MTFTPEIRSEPHQWCLGCERSRNVMLHFFGRGVPSEKAKNWLKKTCPFKGEKKCDFTYRAGITFGPRPSGQTQGDQNVTGT